MWCLLKHVQSASGWYTSYWYVFLLPPAKKLWVYPEMVDICLSCITGSVSVSVSVQVCVVP